MITSAIIVMTISQCLFSAHLLALRVKYSSVYKPLTWFFLVLALDHFFHLAKSLYIGSITSAVMPEFTLSKEMLELSIAPLFWLYVRELTSENAHGLKKVDIVHLLIPMIGAVIIASVIHFALAPLIAPREVASQVGFIGRLSETLNLVILLQFTIYAYWMLKRLSNYQEKLKQFFSDSSNLLELKWIRWIVILIISAVALEVVAQFFNISIDRVPSDYPLINSVLRAVLIWLFAIWGLRQRPELMIELSATGDRKSSVEKYQKSPLSQSKLNEISQNINIALERDKLYRDPHLSLRSLSESINTVPNYVSHALSTEINQNFFDYINSFRIQEAMTLLKTTNDSVASIAADVGFNSRSSFYTAFKRVTKQTPAAYRNTKA